MNFSHCDSYIDDESAPEVLRAYLRWARSPAHGMNQPKPHPTLYANYNGNRVRITMASRLGDLGITSVLDASYGYEARVPVSALHNFSDKP